MMKFLFIQMHGSEKYMNLIEKRISLSLKNKFKSGSSAANFHTEKQKSQRIKISGYAVMLLLMSTFTIMKEVQADSHSNAFLNDTYNKNSISIIDTINIPHEPLTIVGSATFSDCFKKILGEVIINVKGGTPPYTFLWNNGIALAHLMNQSSGTYSVTVTDANGTTATGSYVIEDHSAFHATVQGSPDVCMGELVTLVSDSVQGAFYQWYYNGQLLNGANNSKLVTPMGGTYRVTAFNSCGTFISDSMIVKVHQVGNISTSLNVIICPGESVQLKATGGVSYNWIPSAGLNNANISNPIAAPEKTMHYTVTITNEYGCKTTAAIAVAMCDTQPGSVNPEAANSIFEYKDIGHYPGNKLWIYNKWGSLVYKAHDYDNTWNGISNISGTEAGKKVPPGTYLYVLDLNNQTAPVQGYFVLNF